MIDKGSSGGDGGAVERWVAILKDWIDDNSVVDIVVVSITVVLVGIIIVGAVVVVVLGKKVVVEVSSTEVLDAMSVKVEVDVNVDVKSGGNLQRNADLQQFAVQFAKQFLSTVSLRCKSLRTKWN